MIAYLAEFADTFPLFNVFRYITFRTGAAMITGFIVIFLFGPAIMCAPKSKSPQLTTQNAA